MADERSRFSALGPEIMYRLFFEEALDGMGLADAETGIIFDCNEALAQLVERDRSEIIGQPQTILHPPDEIRDEFSITFTKHREQKQSEKLDAKVITKTGEIKYVEIKAKTIEFAGRKIVHGIFHDTTKRKLAEDALQRRAETLTALHTTALEISSSKALPELLHAIVVRAAGLLHATGGGLYLAEPEKQCVRCVVSYNTARDYTGTLLNYGEGSAGFVAKTGKPLIIDDYGHWSGRATVYEEEQPFRAVLSAPLLWQDEVIGVIHVLRTEENRKFSQEELELLSLFANHAAAAVGNARLYSSMNQELVERKQTEQVLQEQTDLLATIFDNSPNILLLVDSDVRLKKINRAGLDFTENTQSELVGLLGGEVIKCVNSIGGRGCEQNPSCASCPIRSRVMRSLLKGESIYNEEGRLTVQKEGQEFPLEFLISTVPVKVNNAANVLVTLIDNTERKRTEEAFRKSEEEYRRLITHLPIAVFVHSLGKIVLANHVSARILGAESSSELVGMQITQLIPPSYRRIVENRIEKVLNYGSVAPLMEQKLLRLDGNLIDIEITSLPLIYNSQPSILSVFSDITGRKQAENKLKSLLEEKDILLAEIHHRVKNNMQVIASLLNLQSEGIDDERILAVIEESRNRIHSMTLVHEQLYRSQQYSRIDFSLYIDQLASTLFNMYQVDTSKVGFRLEADEIHLDLEKAIPCGLLINELITNSLKYAFPNGQKGLIRIKLSTDNGNLILEFGDDGIGLPVNLNIHKTQSLGLQLIQLLATHDLHGKIHLRSGYGTHYIIELPISISQESP